jgi:glyoxylase-like metal-dependent hydrolase (beta-lactamase superfamily II)
MPFGSTTFGNFRLYTINTGFMRLDGGAMFGVVPKSLWAKRITCDEANRILLTARCLLVQSDVSGRVYLIDTGAGHKFNEKFTKIYGLDFSEHSLEHSLTYHGFTPDDITDVIFTHMHFDHCGGAVRVDEEKKYTPTFPAACHWVHSSQWESVLNPNIREQASFLDENIRPLKESGALKFIQDGHEYEPGFTIETVWGHTAGQQLPLLSDGKRTLLFAADLLPTVAHLPEAWVMSFDIRPLDTFKEKKRVFEKCIRNEILLYLEHDPDHEIIRLGGDPVRPDVIWSGKLDDL